MQDPGGLIISWLIIALLLLMLVLAYPNLRLTRRKRLHNSFEIVHRFAGWTVVVLFWIQTSLIAAADPQSTSTGDALVVSPSFWLLIGISCLILYGWAHLRRQTISITAISAHPVRLHFNGNKPAGGTAIKLTDNPLKETHAFAAIPEPDGKDGYSVLVSKAGDWTGRLIERRPSEIWSRGLPTFGVLRVALLFKPVVIVATGSGIGPCLGLVNQYPGHDYRVIWSTRDPAATYGQQVINTVKTADEHAIVFRGRKGDKGLYLLHPVYAVCVESGAEAVIVIANEKVTRQLVYGLETRGVPAFGPIWDCWHGRRSAALGRRMSCCWRLGLSA